MYQYENNRTSDRRKFLKNIAFTGAWLYLGTGKIFFKNKPNQLHSKPPALNFQYRVLSVKHLKEVKETMMELKKKGKLSHNKTYLKYIGGFQYHKPQSLPDAKAIIILALAEKISIVNFYLEGEKHQIMIPPGYVASGLKLKDIEQLILNKIIKNNNRKLIRTKLPLKMLAVRSGLGKYGKNNICFIKGMGSYLQLMGFYTDHEFKDYHWGRLKMLRICKGCYICKKDCPTNCIRDENFVIDVGKCITLYNELPEPLPEWIPAQAHNSLIGCLKCQLTCPANEERLKDIEILADINEAETKMLLRGVKTETLYKSVASKLKRVYGADDFDYLSRNLRLILS